MDKIKASVFILTRNSEETLKRALDSVCDFDDIIICDGGSSDGTVSLAKDLGARIFFQDPACLDSAKGIIRDYACARNSCLSNTKYDWVLYIDSDEKAGSNLVDEIRKTVLAENAYFAYKIPSGIILDGKEIKYSSNYPGYQLRFFRKSRGSFQKPIHERFVPLENSKIGTFKNPWNYYISSASFLEDYRRDILRDMPIYRERMKNKAILERLYSVLKILKPIAVIAIKTIRNHILHQKESYPVKFEWMRICYQLEIIKTIWKKP